MNLSDKIRIIRKARGYSQEELGEKVGISRQTVSDWEKGKFEPTLVSIRCLAQILEVSFDALLDEEIDLNDKNQLNIILKNLSKETKEKVNSSFRYVIKEYSVSKKDYAFVICYFSSLAVLMIITIFAAIFENSAVYITGIILFFLIAAALALPIRVIKKIKIGGYNNAFGILSKTHFVLNGWSTADFSQTTYVPVAEIEKIELDKSAKEKHGKVVIYLKGRNKTIVTPEIINPQKLIDLFNNLDRFIEI